MNSLRGFGDSRFRPQSVAEVDLEGARRLPDFLPGAPRHLLGRRLDWTCEKPHHRRKRRMAMPAKPRPITPPYYPIIYVRGYAATMREIEETVGTPYMGFNLGSTKVRQRHADDKPVRFIFESPLIRLMKDETYICAYRDGDFVSVGQRVDSRSVWIFRYYEKDSQSFGDGKKDPIESYAEDLRDFILRVRKQVCQGDSAELAKFKVYLVAHSMGGLICRTYLQNVARSKKHHVDKVFTYATPHGGIEMMGLNAPDLGVLDKIHVRNFNRAYMGKYLKLSTGAPVNSLDDHFSPKRFFCFVGTTTRITTRSSACRSAVPAPLGTGS